MISPHPNQRRKRRYSTGLWGVVIPLGLTAVDWPLQQLLTPSNIINDLFAGRIPYRHPVWALICYL